jgi:hypothetical protein
MDRVDERPALDLVEIENGAHLAGSRIGHPVKGGKPAVAMQEEAQHRHHALERAIEFRRHLDLGVIEHGADGKQVEQDVEQDLRTARAVAAVGEDLVVKLRRQPRRGPATATSGRTARGWHRPARWRR